MRPEPSRHIRKNLDRLTKIEEQRKREAELIRLEEERKWRDLEFNWKHILGYISNWGVQAYADAMEDLRPHYVIGDIVRKIFQEVGEAGYTGDERRRLQDELISEERAKYLKIQRELMQIEFPCEVPMTTHYQQAVWALHIEYIADNTNKTLRLRGGRYVSPSR